MSKNFIQLSFVWFFSKRVSYIKDNKNISNLIIRFGQIAVALGIIISLITVSVGLGAKKAIKQKMSDFNGHITIKPYTTNYSFNSSPIDKKLINVDFLSQHSQIVHHQFFSEYSGVIRTEKTFEGVICKGLSDNYDSKRYANFVVKGSLPKYKKNAFSTQVLLSEKIANNLQLDVDSSFIIYFFRKGKEPLYRKFTIQGIFSTEIKDIDNTYLICDIKQLQKLNNWDNSIVGGVEIFIDDIEDIDEVYTSLEPIKDFNLKFQKATERYANITDWIALFDSNIYVIIILMMVVVAINMMMILLILIIERTHSIGVLKTLGANNFTIEKIFINYSLIIMIPGLIVGNLIAITLLLIQKYGKVIQLDPENYFISNVPVHLNPIHILAISLGALLISAIMLLIPSHFIAKISPVKAIRFE